MNKKVLIFLLFVSQIATAQIQIYFPTTRVVLQRSNQNIGTVAVNGKYTGIADSIQARLVPRQAGQGILVDWQSLSGVTSNNTFCGAINGTGGWYNLELRSWRNGSVVFSSTVNRVGIGEVLLIFGHSNAAGNGYPDAPGAADDRVSCVDFNNPVSQLRLYESTADTANLPLTFSQLSSTSGMAPFAEKPWFWGNLGDSLVRKLNVPVLFFSAAFGGSSMYHAYRAATNQPFTHPFISYNQRMPYVNIRNVLKKYTPIVGLRAILSAHGVNDRVFASNSKDTIVFHHQTVINTSRQDAGTTTLAWMVAIAGYINGVIPFVNTGQLELTTSNPNVFRGPDLNTIGNWGRVDDLHFNVAGQVQAAKLWNLSIDAAFLSSTTPILPLSYTNNDIVVSGITNSNQVAIRTIIAPPVMPSGLTNIINPGSNVLYRAGKSITLNPGFKANAGAVFKAQIGGCN
jgi:hypothetical protein